MYIQDSFADVSEWLTELDRYASSNVCKMLVGNKCDQASKRVVDHETAKVI